MSLIALLVSFSLEFDSGILPGFTNMLTSLSHLPDHKQQQLVAITDTIVRAVSPEQVILFGSHATGRWVEYRYREGGITCEYISDYDILVIIRLD